MLRAALSKTRPNTTLQLASRSAPTFFSPHPYFLTAATARGAARAALGNESLTRELVEALQGGIDGLYEFCLKHSGLTLEEIRRWHLARFSTINPLADRIDKMAGKQWYQTPNFWDGGVSEAYTIHTDIDRCVFQIIIYGELFQDSMKSFLEPKLGLPYFEPEVRIEYIKYCVPDWVCADGYKGMDVQKDRGPYEKASMKAWSGHMADQLSLHHVLGCGRWTRLWQAVLRQIGHDFDENELEPYETDETRVSNVSEMRQALWWNAAVACGGLQGLSAVTTTSENGTITAETRARLIQLRRSIEDLNETYLQELIGRTRSFGTNAKTMIAAHPDFRREIRYCARGYWPGT